MKKFILASASALALLTVAACSDNTDSTTTQSTNPPPVEQVDPAQPEAMPPATDGTTTQSIKPAPETGTGGEMQNNDMDGGTQPAPVEPAPAQ